MNKLNFLAGLVIFDILFTVYAVKYMNAIELYPFFPTDISFDFFILVKICVSIIVLFIFYQKQNDKHINFYITFLIFMYGGTTIFNLWQTVNYLYY